jgi:hypothetical protein
VDAAVGEAAESIRTVLLVDNVNGFVARLEALLQERKRDFVLVIAAMKEGADVAAAGDRRPG